MNDKYKIIIALLLYLVGGMVLAIVFVLNEKGLEYDYTKIMEDDIISYAKYYIIIPIIILLFPIPFVPTIFFVGFVTGVPLISFTWVWGMIKRSFSEIISVILALSFTGHFIKLLIFIL